MENEKDKQPDGKQPNDKQQQEPAVKSGEEAIKAARVTDPKPDNKQQQQEKEDAEKWRNEG